MLDSPPDNDEAAETGPTLVRYPKTRVRVVGGRDRGLTIDIGWASARVGTSHDNDVVLTDPTVSLHHCEIEPTAEGIRVRDTGSANGVYSGKNQLFDAILEAPADLRVGATYLRVATSGETFTRLRAETVRFGEVLGQSTRMRELFADLERVAGTELAVFIEGEVGTGKSLIAKSLHRASPRGAKPFVTFDCRATTDPALLERELFGDRPHPGVFERARGGTVFLEEVVDLPNDLQSKLARALEKGEMRRVGGTKSFAIDARVLAGTSRNVACDMERARFRQELYFRIAGAHLTVPPLRDRMEDLPLLVESFLAKAGVPRLSSDVLPILWTMVRSYRWPDNVAELREFVELLLIGPERALRALGGGQLGHDGPFAPNRSGSLPPLRSARREADSAFERLYVKEALKRADENVMRAARLAAVSRQFMTKLIRKHGLRDAAR